MQSRFGGAKLVWICAVILALGLGWWAVRVALTPTVSADLKEEPASILAQVTEQTIGKTLSFNVTAQMATSNHFHNQLAGTVTKVADQTEFLVGQPIYWVDGVAVRVVGGELPFYRSLGPKSKGLDVRQLQQALHDLGVLASSPDGTWGPATTQAVKAWQRDLGLATTGTVEFGELVAVPQFPATLLLTEVVTLGAPISRDVLTVLLAGPQTKFELDLTDQQMTLIPHDTQIDILFEDLIWSAVIADTGIREHGGSYYVLEHPNGGPPCKDACSMLPIADSFTLRSVQHIIPAVTGPGVPSAAVRSDISGSSYVLLEDGTAAPVTVTGAGNGVSILSGLELGTTVTVIERSPTTPDTPPEMELEPEVQENSQEKDQ